MKHTPSWTPKPRSDIIPWNSFLWQQELDNNFNIDSMTDNFTRQAILQIIEDNWDSFCEIGTSRPMLDFEFCIDTGYAKAFYCRQPTYGVHEENIIPWHISQLENNNLIRNYTGPWGDLLLLITKPHQEILY